MKSTLAQMRADMKLRRSISRPDYFQERKCAEALRKVLFLGEELTALCNEVELVEKKISKNRDTPRVVGVITELQEECLARDKKLAQEEIDSGQTHSFFSLSLRNAQLEI